MPTVKFVYIPAHPSDPLEQWSVDYKEDKSNEVECLLDKVKVRGEEDDFFFFRSHRAAFLFLHPLT